MPSVRTLRSAAAELRRQADGAEALLDDVTRTAGEDLWSGPVAQRFADGLTFQRRQMDAVGDDLRRTAWELDRQADRIEAVQAEERRARMAAVSEPPPAPAPRHHHRGIVE